MFLAVLLCEGAHAQQIPAGPVIPIEDPCGYPDTTSRTYKIAAALNWGYGYDSLLADLGRWGKSPFVRVEQLGATVQNRIIYMLTIQDTAVRTTAKRRVWIHARTHPSEVQGTWVTNNMISLLLSNSALGQELRRGCIFNIVPMYNPDGVELQRARQNAHNIDLESNWSTNPGEPEVQVLRATFVRLMADSLPIRVALNMHSSVDCQRYFVYHDASGTSATYGTMQQDFIGLVSNHYPGGFKPWNFFVSWKGSAPAYYPESWFWYNHKEAVLALTYEDMNCASAGNFGTTAQAILSGVGEFLGVLPRPTDVVAAVAFPEGFSLEQNYPNPFNPITMIKYTVGGSTGQGLGVSSVRLVVYDLLGREVAVLVNEQKPAGQYEFRFDATALATGTYICRLTAGSFVESKKMALMR